MNVNSYAKICLTNGYIYKEVEVIEEDLVLNNTHFVKFILNNGSKKILNYQEIQSIELYNEEDVL